MSRTAKALLISLVAHVAVLGVAIVGSARPRRPQLAYVAVALRSPLVRPRFGDRAVSNTSQPQPPSPAPAVRRRRSAPARVASVAPQPTREVDGAPSAGPAAATEAAAGPSGGSSSGAAAAKFVPEAVARAQRLAGAEPVFPSSLVRAGVVYVVQAKICVTVDGAVDRVSVLKSGDPALAANVADAVRGWRYRPLLVDGRAAPFCTFVRFEFRGE